MRYVVHLCTTVCIQVYVGRVPFHLVQRSHTRNTDAHEYIESCCSNVLWLLVFVRVRYALLVVRGARELCQRIALALAAHSQVVVHISSTRQFHIESTRQFFFAFVFLFASLLNSIIRLN